MNAERFLFVTASHTPGRRTRAMGRVLMDNGSSWVIKGICAVRSRDEDRELCFLLEERITGWSGSGEEPANRGAVL